MAAKSATVACPHCGRRVQWGEESPWRPFCSKRCRLIDLGEWLSEERRIPTAEPDHGITPPHEQDDPEQR